MSLNIVFQGNIFDHEDNPIVSHIQGLHVRTGLWSDIRTSENNQYNINLGDGNWLTQNGNVREGDVILLSFWTTNVKTRIGKSDEFCILKIEYDENQKIYINNIKLGLPPSPFLIWDFEDSSIIVNEEATIDSTATNTFQYEYDGNTLYQRNEWYGNVIFKNSGIQQIEYKWEDVFIDSNIFAFDTTGEYSVTTKATNFYGESTESTKILRIENEVPIYDIILPESFSFGDVIAVKDIVTSEHIKRLEHYVNDDLIETNSEKDFDYQYEITNTDNHIFRFHIEYYVGIGSETKFIEYYESQQPENIPPVIELLEYTESDGLYTINQSCYDEDGNIDNYVYQLMYQVPLSNEFKIIDEYHTQDDIQKQYSLNNNGNYKLILLVTDNGGATTTSDIEFYIDNVCSDNILLSKNRYRYDGE